MLPSGKRLRQFRDFQQVYKAGRSYYAAVVRIKASRTELPETRFGIVVPNKLVKKATERNRKKRQIRGALQTLIPIIKPGYDVVVSAQPTIREATYDDILRDLSEILKKAGVI